MVVFIIELCVSSYSLPGYLWSFFFWLDLISVMSMPMDINLFVEWFSGESDNLIFQTDDASNVARVGRASRVGTRAGRYIKLVKLIKIVKVGKFFSQANKIQLKREQILAKKLMEQKEQAIEIEKQKQMEMMEKNNQLIRR